MTKIWLADEEYVPFAPDKPGTRHIHHCKPGRSNDRLYITRKDDDTILAHCFHCGARGRYSVAGSGAISREARARSYERLGKNDTYAIPRLGGSEPESPDRTYREGLADSRRAYLREWPLQARKWWLECGLTIPEQEYYGVTYNAKENAIDMPIFTGVTVGGMCRRTLDGGEHTPKYVLVGDRISNAVTPKVWHTDDPIVVVEDMRSAYKVARIVPAYPLLGTELQDPQVIKIISCKASKALIYLDNDNEMVKRKARDIKKRLDIYMPCDIITVEQDPKNLTEDELRNLIK